jgi:AcrR family transcriptional regulator
MTRTRRAGSEVRALLLDAAQELFAERGFAGTTTREIASRAGVSETLLFRHFSSKQTMFEVAVVEPFDSYIARYTGDWIGDRALEADPEDIIGDLVSTLYELCVERRQTFLALTMSHLAGGAQQALGRLDDMAIRIAEQRGYSYDAPVTTRAVVTMIGAMALLEGDLYPSGETPDRGRIVEELTRILVGGLTKR